MEYRYFNPWAKQNEPAEYVRRVEPIEYKGCEIFHVSPLQWDTVKDDVCIAQRVTLDGAKHAADLVADELFPDYQTVRKRMFEEITT